METFINRKRIIILFLIMISITSFYYVYKKVRLKKPIAAKLVIMELQVPRKNHFKNA